MAVRKTGRTLADARVKVVLDAKNLAKDVKDVTEKALGDVGEKGGTNFGKRMTKQVVDAAEDAGKRGGRKLGDQFGEAMNRRLRDLDVDEIDVKADPKTALAAIKLVEEKLDRLAHDATAVDIRVRTNEALGELEKFKRKMRHVGDDEGAPAARGFFGRFFQAAESSLGTHFSKAFRGGLTSPIVITAIAVVAATLAPLIGGVIAGAVVGGVGLGGIVGGLILAARDPAVAGWAKRIGDNFLKGLNEAAKVFKGPLLDSMALIEGAARRATGSIGKIFANSAPQLNTFTRSLIRAGEALLDSFVVATERSGPAVKALGGLIEGVSAALGRMVTAFAADSKEGASALDDLTLALEYTIDAVTGLVHYLAVVKGNLDAVDDVIDKTRYHIENMVPGLDLTADGFKKNSKEALAYRRHTLGVATAQDELLLSGSKALEATTRLKGAQASAAVTADTVAKAQKNVKAVQDAMAHTLESLGGKTSLAAQRSDVLRTAMDNLYGATMKNVDANQTFEQSWDDLTSSVKDNKTSLDVHTQAGRNNRTAIKNLLVASGELYLSNIAAGESTDSARRKHDARTKSIEKEANKLGLNKTKTQELIKTYNNIPPDKLTNLLLTGVRDIVHALNQLYIYQRALATGKSIESVENSMRRGIDMPSNTAGGGLAAGGQVGGWSPTSYADNIPAMLTAKEWVHPVDAVRYYGPNFMEAIQKRQIPREVLSAFSSGALGRLGDLPFFATGGQVAPVDTSRLWKFYANMADTRIPSKREVASRIPGGDGARFVRSQNGKPYIWASAGPAGYDCSGIVSAVYNVLHGRKPYTHTFSTGSLPGKWFPKPGIGGPLTAAWSHPGQYPASSTTGHMMGMVGGLTFESSGSRGVHLGSSTRRLSDFRHRAHYADGGYVIPNYDRGGPWANNTIGINTSGRTEHVTTGADRDEQVTLLRRIVSLLETLAPDSGAAFARAMQGTAPGLLAMARRY